MTYLEQLRAASGLRDLARILAVKPKTLSFLIYKIPVADRYYSFEIPKSSGGHRKIDAPIPQLSMIQRRLANVLTACVLEIEKSEPVKSHLAHGYLPKRSILTNAKNHKKRRFVFNIDLKDFFPSLNFGRVRGYFIADARFKLHKDVATIIAQISCHENSLPQGSPCSPILSNLLTNFLDVRIARLAKDKKVTYSRYVDDITFSTNARVFPEAIAIQSTVTSNAWNVGSKLAKQVTRAGFTINTAKTRMQLRGSRQTATGLMLNEKVNIRPEYYRDTRSMAHSLFKSGMAYKKSAATLSGGPKTPFFSLEPVNLNQVEGRLNHIAYIKDMADLRSESEKKQSHDGITKLAAKFKFFRLFVTLDRPLLITEGPTDYIYIKEAIKSRTAYHPALAQPTATGHDFSIRFLHYKKRLDRLLHLGGGSSDLAKFIATYEKNVERYAYQPIGFPVIVLVDNDNGGAATFGPVQKKGKGPAPTLSTTNSFYRVTKNLYLVKTPEKAPKPNSCIEDLFDPALLSTKIGGLDFDPDKKHDEKGKYGKQIFADKVVRAGASTIDFSGFDPLLDRIVAVISDYAASP